MGLATCYYSNKIVRVVYNHLNKSLDAEDTWSGWKALWNLRVMPKVKFFIWKVMQGKLPTFNFLYSINDGQLCGVYFVALL